MDEIRKPPLRVFWIETGDIVWGVPRGSRFGMPAARPTCSGETPPARKAGRIGVMPRPHPDAFHDLKQAGVDVVVSLLEAAEARSLMLANEGGLCAAARIEFLSLPVVDHGVPQSVRPVVRMASEIAFRLAESKNVVVHCFAGIGRSPLMIASVLIDHGLGTEEACALISAARGRTVPEMQSQLQWLKAYERMRLAG